MKTVQEMVRVSIPSIVSSPAKAAEHSSLLLPIPSHRTPSCTPQRQEVFGRDGGCEHVEGEADVVDDVGEEAVFFDVGVEVGEAMEREWLLFNEA